MHRFTFIIRSAMVHVLVLVSGTIASAEIDSWHVATDEDLIRLPILVVGHWNKSSLNRLEERTSATRKGTALGRYGSRTELVIERVIRGDIKPGTYQVFFDSEVVWKTQHGEREFWSYHHSPWSNVDEFADSNLWFLRFAPDVPEGKEPFLELLNDRAVQPLSLEPYYAALVTARPDDEVPKLLVNSNPTVVIRAIEYVNGGELPWPYDRYDSRGPHLTLRPQKFTCYAGDIEALIARPQSDVRLKAAATYAVFAKRESVPTMRRLLADRDANMRTIAAGSLIRYDDHASAEDIPAAVRGLDNFIWACQLIELIQTWESPYAVPALIELLDTFGRAIEYGYYTHVPAYHAQSALKTITGLDFPCDVEISRQAWQAVSAIGDENLRKERLRDKLPGHVQPFSTEITRDGPRTSVQLTNRSPKAAMITTKPFGIDFNYPGRTGGGGGSNRQPSGASDFCTLQPGESIRIDIQTVRDVESVRLMYRFSGAEFGLKAWVGVVVAKNKR